MESEVKAQLKLAFSFICPSCGSKQYVDAELHEFTPDEQVEGAMEIGERPVTGDWVTCPELVTCSQCNGVFDAENGGEHGH